MEKHTKILTKAGLQNVKTKKVRSPFSSSPQGTKRHFVHVQGDIKNNYMEE